MPEFEFFTNALGPRKDSKSNTESETVSEDKKTDDQKSNSLELQLPKMRLTASGQLTLAVISLTFIAMFVCDKAFLLAMCICKRLIAEPNDP